MKEIIKTVYIITTNDDKFNKIKGNIGSNLQIVRVKGVDKKELDDETIDTITTGSCRYLCSNGTISRWLTHYNLWREISKKGDNGNVLIIDDDGMPVDAFIEMLYEYWKEIPKEWDMIYLGCIGSCNSSIVNDAIYRVFKSRTNNDVYINDKKMVYVIEPGYPLGLYGYMLSKRGVDKLVNSPELKDIQTDLDYAIADKLIINNDFKAYAFSPPLIRYIPTERLVTNHDVLKPITEKFQISESSSVATLWDTPIYHIRPLCVDLTYITFILILISFIVGYSMDNLNQRIFIGIMTIIQLTEMALSKTDRPKLKNLLFELILIYVSFAIGQLFQKR
jgi:hypothetical protein